MSGYKNTCLTPMVCDKVRINESASNNAYFTVEQVDEYKMLTMTNYSLQLKCIYSNHYYYNTDMTYFIHANEVYKCICNADTYQLCMFQFD